MIRRVSRSGFAQSSVKMGLLTFALMLIVGAQSAQAADESRICLHDGRGDRSSAAMPNCELPSDIDGSTIGGAPGVDGGYFVSMGNYTEFKASRRRVSDDYDVKWSQDLAKRGLLVDVSGGVAQYRAPTPFWGVRVNHMSSVPGAYDTAPVFAFGRCAYITNVSGKDIFVPIKTDREWSSFLTAAVNGTMPGVSVNTCAYFCPGTCNNRIVFGPTSKKAEDKALDNGSLNNWFRVELPFAPTGATWPTAKGVETGMNRHTFNYSCVHTDVVPDSSGGYCTEYETVPGECDVNGKNCLPDTQVCKTPGSRCVKSEKPWSETWEIPLGNLRAGVGGVVNGAWHSGWEYVELFGVNGSASRQVAGGTRPCGGDGYYEYGAGSGKLCGKPKCDPTVPGNKCGGGTPSGGEAEPVPTELACF